MKNLFFTVLTLSFLYSATAQQQVNFRIRYQPNTTYKQVITQGVETSLKYAGDPGVLKTLKKQGIENPTLTKKVSETEAAYKTFSTDSTGQFPITITFLKTTSSDGQKSIPNGTVVHGHSSVNDFPTVDSVQSDNLSAEFKKTLLQTMKSLFEQMKLPEKMLKIGESFTEETPITIPIGPMKLEMVIVTNYKLLSVSNGIANINITQTYVVKSEIMNADITGTGKGAGFIKYDIANTFNTYYELNSEMQMAAKIEKVKLTVDVKSTFKQDVVITK